MVSNIHAEAGLIIGI